MAIASSSAAHWRQGQAPLWDLDRREPILERGGGAFSPFVLVHLSTSDRWGARIDLALRMALAGIGVGLLAKACGVMAWARWLTASLLMLPLALLHATWIPWIALSIVWLTQCQTWLRLTLLSLVVTAVALEGDVRLLIAAGVAVLLTSGILTFRLGRQPVLRALPARFLALLIGLGLAGVQWVPILQYRAQDAAANPAATIIAGLPSTPGAWIVPQSRWFKDRALVLAALSAPGFNPSQVVLVDDQVPADSLEWLNRVVPDPHDARSPFNQPPSWAVPKIDSIARNGNRIVVKTTSGGTSWIVFDQPFAAGWTARSKPIGKFVTMAMSRERIVLPAYGSWCVVPVMNEAVAAEVTFEYKPASFRRGILLSAGSALLLILLGGVALHGRRV